MKTKALYDFLREQSETMTGRLLESRTHEPVSVYSIDVSQDITEELREQNQHFIDTIVNLLEDPSADRLSI
jgi:rsbT co-antagonist protein RsbR